MLCWQTLGAAAHTGLSGRGPRGRSLWESREPAFLVCASDPQRMPVDPAPHRGRQDASRRLSELPHSGPLLLPPQHVPGRSVARLECPPGSPSADLLRRTRCWFGPPGGGLRAALWSCSRGSAAGHDPSPAPAALPPPRSVFILLLTSLSVLSPVPRLQSRPPPSPTWTVTWASDLPSLLPGFALSTQLPTRDFSSHLTKDSNYPESFSGPSLI